MIIFRKRSILDLWLGFEYTYLSISTHPLVEWPRAMYFMVQIENTVYYWEFRHTQAYSRSYSDIFSHIMACLKFWVTFAYSEPCHFENRGIFRTHDIFRTLSRHILTYSERYVTLAYWQPCHIQNFVIFRILAYLGHEAYSESCLFRYIQAYSDIFYDNSYDNIHFLFFTLMLHTFLFLKLKRHIFLTTMTSI